MVPHIWVAPDGSWADSLVFGAMKHSGKSDLMQFTGLYDRNNVPVYEGDIVRSWTPDLNDNPHGKYRIEEIGFCCGTFTIGFDPNVPDKYKWVPIRDVIDADEPHNFLGKYEVVGNRYESPELLNS